MFKKLVSYSAKFSPLAVIILFIVYKPASPLDLYTQTPPTTTDHIRTIVSALLNLYILFQYLLSFIVAVVYSVTSARKKPYFTRKQAFISPGASGLIFLCFYFLNAIESNF